VLRFGIYCVKIDFVTLIFAFTSNIDLLFFAFIIGGMILPYLIVSRNIR